MTVCGLVDVKLTLNLINCWLNGKSLSLIVMTSARVCGRRGRLYFVDERARVIAAYYLEKVLLKLVEDCEQLQPNDFIFQQDADPAYAAGVTQDWLKSNYIQRLHHQGYVGLV